MLGRFQRHQVVRLGRSNNIDDVQALAGKEFFDLGVSFGAEAAGKGAGSNLVKIADGDQLEQVRQAVIADRCAFPLRPAPSNPSLSLLPWTIYCVSLLRHHGTLERPEYWSSGIME
jgi:hypothetical protein